jgi:hypothetical protein
LSGQQVNRNSLKVKDLILQPGAKNVQWLIKRMEEDIKVTKPMINIKKPKGILKIWN